jgi:hypothetical protein
MRGFSSEQWRNILLNKHCIEAFANRQIVQWQTENGTWVDLPFDEQINFTDSPQCYRIKTQMQRVAIHLNELPQLCWIRFEGVEFLVTATARPSKVQLGTGWYTIKELVEKNAEYSSDGVGWKVLWREIPL